MEGLQEVRVTHRRWHLARVLFDTSTATHTSLQQRIPITFQDTRLWASLERTPDGAAKARPFAAALRALKGATNDEDDAPTDWTPLDIDHGLGVAWWTHTKADGTTNTTRILQRKRTSDEVEAVEEGFALAGLSLSKWRAGLSCASA